MHSNLKNGLDAFGDSANCSIFSISHVKLLEYDRCVSS